MEEKTKTKKGKGQSVADRSSNEFPAPYHMTRFKLHPGSDSEPR